MSENKTFQLAIVVSILAHSAFFLGVPNIPLAPSKKSLDKLTITYYKIKKTVEEKKLVEKKPEAVVSKLPEIKKEEILAPPKPVAEKPKNIRKKISQTTATEPIKEKRFEKVIEEEKDSARKAAYISYYKAVREKIKHHADKNYPRTRRLGEGEVFLSFVVASSGELLQVKVVDSKSEKNTMLREIAINSLRDASPFPSFPKGMSQYQITFNIIIFFESNL
ncbi:MAG: TonB family protein [Candidatus Omnitrophica bacterium]|nr:TonB family protein [Candidatus Omnitrophota bacterium]